MKVRCGAVRCGWVKKELGHMPRFYACQTTIKPPSHPGQIFWAAHRNIGSLESPKISSLVFTIRSLGP
ncbi:hypothetical protein U1Q18_005643, partial [Sarracenia purpurea var. burkii]